MLVVPAVEHTLWVNGDGKVFYGPGHNSDKLRTEAEDNNIWRLVALMDEAYEQSGLWADWCRYMNIFTQKMVVGTELAEYVGDPLDALSQELREVHWQFCKVRDRFRV